jgi:hypothetical protein
MERGKSVGKTLAECFKDKPPEEINLRRCLVHRGATGTLAQVLSFFPKTKILRLNKNSYRCDTFYRNICSSKRKDRYDVIIKLEINILCEAIQNYLPNLQVLDLSWNAIDCADAKLIARLLKTQNITELNLKRTTLSDSGIATLCESLKSNRSLQSLLLSGSRKFKKLASKAVIDLLETNHRLSTLDVSDCDIKENMMILLAEILKSHPSLTDLDISENNGWQRETSEEVAKAIAEVIRVNRTLQSINVYEMVDDKQIKYYIIPALEENFVLTNLLVREFDFEQDDDFFPYNFYVLEENRRDAFIVNFGLVQKRKANEKSPVLALFDPNLYDKNLLSIILEFLGKEPKKIEKEEGRASPLLFSGGGKRKEPAEKSLWDDLEPEPRPAKKQKRD